MQLYRWLATTVGGSLGIDDNTFKDHKLHTNKPGIDQQDGLNQLGWREWVQVPRKLCKLKGKLGIDTHASRWTAKVCVSMALLSRLKGVVSCTNYIAGGQTFVETRPPNEWGSINTDEHRDGAGSSMQVAS